MLWNKKRPSALLRLDSSHSQKALTYGAFGVAIHYYIISWFRRNGRVGRNGTWFPNDFFRTEVFSVSVLSILRGGATQPQPNVHLWTKKLLVLMGPAEWSLQAVSHLTLFRSACSEWVPSMGEVSGRLTWLQMEEKFNINARDISSSRPVLLKLSVMKSLLPLRNTF